MTNEHKSKRKHRGNMTLFCEPCGKGKKVTKTQNHDRTTFYSLECGHRHITKEFYESLSLVEILVVKSKGIIDFSKKHRYKYEATIGNRVGRDGKLAYMEQVIDRVNNYYKKLVKQGDKTIKDIEGKLTDHN